MDVNKSRIEHLVSYWCRCREANIVQAHSSLLGFLLSAMSAIVVIPLSHTYDVNIKALEGLYPIMPKLFWSTTLSI